MTPNQKEVWDLRSQGHTFQSIAETLGISRRSVRERYNRAEKKDPAITSAMKAFGLNLEPSMVWLKNKDYSIQVKPKAAEEVDFLDKVSDAFFELPPAMPIPAPQETLPESLVVYPIFDAHLGMRAHAEISGEEMDLATGSARITSAMARVMVGAPDAQRGVIINGGDFTHQTDDMNRTRRSGHILDVDGRNIITVLEGIEVIATCIEMALTKHELVEYFSVPGNHDLQNWETILIGLRERYKNNPRVNINFTLTEFSVVEHGEVVVFIHHGDKRTPKDLAMFCAAEYPEVWGRTRYRIVMTGHLHHIKVDEFPGIYWMQMPALTVRDQHASGGYKSHSLVMAIGFDRKSEVSRNQVKL